LPCGVERWYLQDMFVAGHEIVDTFEMKKHWMISLQNIIDLRHRGLLNIQEIIWT
jgi:hypothetical protein